MVYSGPKRYDYVPTANAWQYLRDNVSLSTLLSEELSLVFGKHIVIDSTID